MERDGTLRKSNDIKLVPHVGFFDNEDLPLITAKGHPIFTVTIDKGHVRKFCESILHLGPIRKVDTCKGETYILIGNTFLTIVAGDPRITGRSEVINITDTIPNVKNSHLYFHIK